MFRMLTSKRFGWFSLVTLVVSGCAAIVGADGYEVDKGSGGSDSTSGGSGGTGGSGGRAGTDGTGTGGIPVGGIGGSFVGGIGGALVGGVGGGFTGGSGGSTGGSPTGGSGGTTGGSGGSGGSTGGTAGSSGPTGGSGGGMAGRGGSTGGAAGSSGPTGGSGGTAGSGGSAGGTGGSVPPGGSGGTAGVDGGPGTGGSSPDAGPTVTSGDLTCTGNTCPMGLACQTPQYGPPGLCVSGCTVPTDCDAQHACVGDPDYGFPYSCLKKCNVNASSCGVGTVCVPVDVDIGAICQPLEWVYERGIGDDCSVDAMCTSGTCRNKPNGWCSKPCGSADPLCAHDPGSYENRFGEFNWCVLTAGAQVCAGGCDIDPTVCQTYYPGTTCRAMTDVTGSAVSACLP